MEGADALVLLRLLRACRRPGDLSGVVRLAATCRALWRTFRAHRRELLSLCVPLVLVPPPAAGGAAGAARGACSHPAVLHAGAFGPERVAVLRDTGDLVVADLRVVGSERRRTAARRDAGRGGAPGVGAGAAPGPGPAGDVGGPVVGFSPDGAWLADGGVWPHVPLVRLWDVRPRPRRRPSLPRPGPGRPRAPASAVPAEAPAPALLKSHNARCFGVAFSPRGRYLATGAYDRTVVLWDLLSPAQGMLPRERHRLTAERVAMPSTGAGAGGESGVRTLRAPSDLMFTCLGWGPDGTRLATGTAHGEVMLWEPEHGQVHMRLAGGALGAPFSDQFALQPGTKDVWVPRANWRRVVECLAWSPDGSRLAAAMAPDALVVWGSDGRVLAEHAAGAAAAWGRQVSLCWSPDGEALAVARAHGSGSRDDDDEEEEEEEEDKDKDKDDEGVVCVHSLRDGDTFDRPMAWDASGARLDGDVPVRDPPRRCGRRAIVGLAWAPSTRLVVFALDEACAVIVDAIDVPR